MSFNPYVSTYSSSHRYDPAIQSFLAAQSQPQRFAVPPAGAVSIAPVSAAAVSSAVASVAAPYEPMKQTAQYRSATTRPAPVPAAAAAASAGPRSVAEYDALRARYAIDNPKRKSAKKHDFDYEFTHQQLSAERTQTGGSATHRPATATGTATPRDSPAEYYNIPVAGTTKKLPLRRPATAAAAAAPATDEEEKSRAASPTAHLSPHAAKKWAHLGGRDTHAAMHSWDDTVVAPADQSPKNDRTTAARAEPPTESANGYTDWARRSQTPAEANVEAVRAANVWQSTTGAAHGRGGSGGWQRAWASQTGQTEFAPPEPVGTSHRAGARSTAAAAKLHRTSLSVYDPQSAVGKPLWHPNAEWQRDNNPESAQATAAMAAAAAAATARRPSTASSAAGGDTERVTPVAGIVTGGRESRVVDSLNWRDATAVRADPTQAYSGSVDPAARLQRAHPQLITASASARDPILDGEVKAWKPSVVVSSIPFSAVTDPLLTIPASAAPPPPRGSTRGPGARPVDTSTPSLLTWHGEPTDQSAETMHFGRKSIYNDRYRDDSERPPPRPHKLAAPRIDPTAAGATTETTNRFEFCFTGERWAPGTKAAKKVFPDHDIHLESRTQKERPKGRYVSPDERNSTTRSHTVSMSSIGMHDGDDASPVPVRTRSVRNYPWSVSTQTTEERVLFKRKDNRVYQPSSVNPIVHDFGPEFPLPTTGGGGSGGGSGGGASAAAASGDVSITGHTRAHAAAPDSDEPDSASAPVQSGAAAAAAAAVVYPTSAHKRAAANGNRTFASDSVHLYDNSGGICPPRHLFYGDKRTEQRAYEQQLHSFHEQQAGAAAQSQRQLNKQKNNRTSGIFDA